MRLSISPTLIAWIIAILLLSVGFSSVYYLLAPQSNELETLLYYGGVCVLLLLYIIVFQLFNTRVVASQIADARTAAAIEQIALFEELYRNSPVPYLRIKKNGDILSANASAIRLFGVEEGRLDNLNIYHHLTVSEETKASILPSQIARGNYINEVEVSLRDSDNALHWALLSAFPYGRKHERLITLFDITKQKEVDIAKSEFVSLASHQLRTPISAMRWNLELLQASDPDSLTPEHNKYLNKVTRNVEKMLLIINDFLSVSQLEMGTFATEVTKITLGEFLEQIYEEFNDRISDKNITLNKAYGPGILEITTDKNLLHNIVSNLVSNAVKYTPEGGTISVTYKVAAGNLNMTISDSGMGIPKEEQDRLFTKFFRASNAKQGVTEGTGLGLYIVAKAVETLRGTITVESTAGFGARFTIIIPLK